MTDIPNYNYKKLPNACYFCGLMLFREAETAWVDHEILYMSQPKINVKRAEMLADIPEVRDTAGIAVLIDDHVFVMDGHHRAYAAYLRGDKRVFLRIVDLNKVFTEQVERHKGKDKIDLYDITAADIQEIGLLD